MQNGMRPLPTTSAHLRGCSSVSALVKSSSVARLPRNPPMLVVKAGEQKNCSRVEMSNAMLRAVCGGQYITAALRCQVATAAVGTRRARAHVAAAQAQATTGCLRGGCCHCVPVPPRCHVIRSQWALVLWQANFTRFLPASTHAAYTCMQANPAPSKTEGLAHMAHYCSSCLVPSPGRHGRHRASGQQLAAVHHARMRVLPIPRCAWQQRRS